MTNPPEQADYPHRMEHSPHINWIRNKSAQKNQEAQVHMSPWQNVCSPQTQNFVKLEANKGKRWPGWWKLVHTILTNTEDHKSRPRNISN
jgi:hypothetical protein